MQIQNTSQRQNFGALKTKMVYGQKLEKAVKKAEQYGFSTSIGTQDKGKTSVLIFKAFNSHPCLEKINEVREKVLKLDLASITGNAIESIKKPKAKKLTKNFSRENPGKNAMDWL